ncbi:hypothetical protein [Solidesulfovibrio sp.]|uniref:hypothetical protein n=1 Tax=Solidesulfovibrio sp. TaxID=2910990 RepID=UPI0026376C2B|nr:hypothetical protein [Solidesulfovibrio sp.]
MSLQHIPFYDGIASRCAFVGTTMRNVMKRNATKKPEAFLRISQLHDRYMYLLAEFFVQAGYYVYIAAPIKIEDYYKRDAYAAYVGMSKNMKYTKYLVKTDRPKALLCSDSAVDGRTASMFEMSIFLNYDVDIPPGTRDGALVLPYPMHPNVYRTGQVAMIPELRRLPKCVGVFFAGNIKPEYASESKLLRHYVSRPAAVESVLRRFGRRVRLFSRREALLRALAEEDLGSSIVVFDATTERLGREEWFPVLARSRFFLALPGVVMPMCHNCVEAMALGVVPILGYGQLFSPPLESGAVCLEYVSEAELAAAIETALAMDATTYARMRRRSLDHYDRYMVPSAFLRGLSHARGRTVELRFAAEGVSEKVARTTATAWA